MHNANGGHISTLMLYSSKWLLVQYCTTITGGFSYGRWKWHNKITCAWTVCTVFVHGHYEL